MARIKPRPYRHKNGWRVTFCLFGKKYAKYVGQNKQYAYFFQSKINHIVLQIRYGFIDLPQKDLGNFVFSQVIKKPSAPQPETPQKNISVKEFIDECIANAREHENNSNKTEIIHLNHLNRFLQHSKKNPYLKNIDIDFFAQYKKYRKKKDVTAKTINKEICTFRKIFHLAVDKKYIEENIVERIKSDKEDSNSNVFRTTAQIKELLTQGSYSDKEIKKIQRYRYLDYEEINQFIESTKKRMGENHWMIPVIVTLCDTGIRRSELLRLTWLDVDFDKNLLYIYSNKQSKKKNKVRREVYLSPRLKATLRAQKETAKERWVFPGPNGGQLSVSTLRTAFLKVIKDTDYEGIGCHCFRHSYVSILAEKGVNKQVIGDLVGHTSQEMTEHYRHLFPGAIEEAVKKVFG